MREMKKMVVDEKTLACFIEKGDFIPLVSEEESSTYLGGPIDRRALTV